MFRLFKAIRDCNKKKPQDIPDQAADRDDELRHVRSMAVNIGSMSSSGCTQIGGVVISGSNGEIKITVPDYETLVFKGNSFNANKYKDGHGNVAVDVLVHPVEKLVQYTAKDGQLTVTDCHQRDVSNAMRPH